jgi:hypothetical protein
VTGAGPDGTTSAPSAAVGPPDASGGPYPEAGPPRNPTARFAWAAIAVILVGVIALVVYALTGPSASPGVVSRATTSAAMVTALTRVPASVFDTVGIDAPATPLVAPSVLTGQPPLDSMGKPEVLYIGAEFCPFCGAERWALIVALSRFGNFATLTNMQSAQLSVFPALQTFSFVGSTYSSKYVSFTGVELYSDAVDAHGAFTRIAALSPDQSELLERFGTAPGRGGNSGSYPFVDVGNTLVTSTSGFSPGVIVGQSQSTIANAVSQPTNPIGQAIVASANYLTAGICQATHEQPGPVCSSKGTRSAAQALGLG